MTIISHQHRFIFLRTRKTASSSVFASLARYAGPSDLIAHVPDARKKYGVLPKNNLRPWASLSTSDKMRGWRAWCLDRIRPQNDRRPRLERFLEVIPEHMTAQEIRDFLPPSMWDSYYKFCFERNPFDRAISLWVWRQHVKGSQFPFDRFLDALESDHRETQKRYGASHGSNWPIYTIDNEIVMDRVYRYEELGQSLDHAGKMIGIPFDGWLPSLKKGHRNTKTGPPHEFLSREQRQRLRQIFAREIEAFGYDFNVWGSAESADGEAHAQRAAQAGTTGLAKNAGSPDE
ncbi:sulfotransferase family 2 domain-containing protein [Thioalkalivibrio sp. ALJ2]|uniref:sulfotransferase family 2 domain-containing protein n=1 Tax=Thioalkalivibrio sp. ALJ2 TaxID=1261622 RepID=UPI0009D92887|nr:sulfotransferase family 2 domain-containing protein [Thioalkalivibrio sp. ALJ2]